MNQLRTSDLFMYKQNFSNHREKIKKIKDRSIQSIRSICQKQVSLLNRNNQYHKKAFVFKENQKIKFVQRKNQNFVNRLIQKNVFTTKKLLQKINKSKSQILQVKENLRKSSIEISRSRSMMLSKQNDRITKKLIQTKSTILSKSLSKDYINHLQRSSNLSKFKIDCKKFTFIPKNQILLSRISKIKPLKLSNIKKQNQQKRIKKNFISLSERVKSKSYNKNSQQIFNPQKIIKKK